MGELLSSVCRPHYGLSVYILTCYIRAVKTFTNILGRHYSEMFLLIRCIREWISFFQTCRTMMFVTASKWRKWCGHKTDKLQVCTNTSVFTFWVSRSIHLFPFNGSISMDAQTWGKELGIYWPERVSENSLTPYMESLRVWIWKKCLVIPLWD